MNAINQTMLSKQYLSDAEHYYRILTNPSIEHFTILPESIESEKEWIQSNYDREKKNLEFHYTILYNNEIAGSIGVRRQAERQEIGIVGYFIDPNFWGMGIASEALRTMEMICKNDLNLKILRLEIMIENKASERVAIKRCFSKVATLKNYLKDKFGKERDSYIYEKVLYKD
ncbi:MAG: GNAT family N-acetyltransferase [Cytophagales bacterium]